MQNLVKPIRLVILAVVFVVLMAIYLVELYKLQIIEGAKYYAVGKTTKSETEVVPAARGNSTRVELRCPDPACNPYLALAVCLTAGLDGIERRARTMQNLRDNAPKEICGNAVAFVGDYLAETITYADGKVEGTGLPQSDVLYYGLANGDVAVVRPSGTEPKIKIYYLVGANSREALAEKLECYGAETDKLVK